MCERCEERCARSVHAITHRENPSHDPALHDYAGFDYEVLSQADKDWLSSIARAVRKAGRLSECPEAVEAACLLAWDPLVRSRAVVTPRMREERRELLRAAEDAALGKGTHPDVLGFCTKGFMEDMLKAQHEPIDIPPRPPPCLLGCTWVWDPHLRGYWHYHEGTAMSELYARVSIMRGDREVARLAPLSVERPNRYKHFWSPGCELVAPPRGSQPRHVLKGILVEITPNPGPVTVYSGDGTIEEVASEDEALKEPCCDGAVMEPHLGCTFGKVKPK